MIRTLIILLLSCSLSAQETTGEEAINKVFKVLSGAEKEIPAPEKREELLKHGAWEALAYIDRSKAMQLSREDLQEAVPDYYRFKDQKVIFKLIDQKNYNQYGYEGVLPYHWQGKQIVILSKDGKAEKDRWDLLYLDAHYLALRMGEISVFFTHTKAQET